MSALLSPLLGLASRVRGLLSGSRTEADYRAAIVDDGDDWICFSESDLSNRPNPAAAMTVPQPVRRPTRVAA